MLRDIRGTQRLPRMLFFKVTGTGTAVIDVGGQDATLTDNGTGDYTLTLVEPGQRLLSAVATPIATAGDIVCTIQATSSASAIRVVAFDCTDGTTAKDGVFYLQVALSDAADET